MRGYIVSGARTLTGSMTAKHQGKGNFTYRLSFPQASIRSNCPPFDLVEPSRDPPAPEGACWSICLLCLPASGLRLRELARSVSGRSDAQSRSSVERSEGSRSVASRRAKFGSYWLPIDAVRRGLVELLMVTVVKKGELEARKNCVAVIGPSRRDPLAALLLRRRSNGGIISCEMDSFLPKYSDFLTGSVQNNLWPSTEGALERFRRLHECAR